MGKEAVVAECDTHGGGCRKEEEHTELEPIDTEVVEVDGHCDEGGKCREDQEDRGDPVDAAKRNFAKHGRLKNVHNRLC